MGNPHTMPEGTPTLTITATVEGHTFPIHLEPEERETWLACFRSAFGPKLHMVDELTVERGIPDATIRVSWDGTRATFYPDGRIRQEEHVEAPRRVRPGKPRSVSAGRRHFDPKNS